MRLTFVDPLNLVGCGVGVGCVCVSGFRECVQFLSFSNNNVTLKYYLLRHSFFTFYFLFIVNVCLVYFKLFSTCTVPQANRQGLSLCLFVFLSIKFLL